ncbi:hypothetical protein EDD98_6232 [Streptomyces sp. PanSC19]|uniref:hypothetical protein n=1 Tax=Streptomyces sp. PanSC19 TaxID=1520455 RepID=UPI000F4759DD|nr:hypothetical protein [Streptomyces sp. PanSC19]ROQ26587.1 hypothetical protein EDD98_6232 [Streptomyces sp. PanSC19]
MDTTRESSSRSRRPREEAVSGTYRPPAALWAYLVLLVLVFGGSYALGTAVGPVGPGARPSPTDGPRDTGHGSGHEHAGAHR